METVESQKQSHSIKVKDVHKIFCRLLHKAKIIVESIITDWMA